ncbi:unnamed protein product [Nyctereutes procyonoides]|uniref:(raccoon dog) hypothetical protein n=1 Tax=Nyctereutes procyonoides TaxID=34880 RepID=A0A811ZS98_NYCPR|nr:unnamed protein product [Nyctereutes procyonoides]
MVTTIEQLAGREYVVENKGFDKYTKEGMEINTCKTIQFSCNLGEKFKETTADGRKTQTICNFTNSTLVQHQEKDGKENTVTR